MREKKLSTAVRFTVLVVSFFIFATSSMAKQGSSDTVSKKKDVQTERAREAIALDTIIVSANKQEENSQDIPFSITVLRQMDLEDKQIASLSNIVDFVPNVSTFDWGMGGFNNITSRGLSAPSFSWFTTSMGMYIDGVPALGAFGYTTALLDIERIEILRGPQGTLYGKNTETGAINIITQKPDNQFRGKVAVEGGSLLSAESGDKLAGGGQFSLSGPVVADKLFVGLAGLYTHKDGFTGYATAGGTGHEKDTSYGRAKLRWNPSDQLDITLLAALLSEKIDGYKMNLSKNGATLFRIPQPGYRQIASDLKGSQEMTIDTQSLTVAYSLNNTLTFTSITSRRNSDFEGTSDNDFSPLHLAHGTQDSSYEKISQELRLDAATDTFSWIIGAYYDTDEIKRNFVVSSMRPQMAGASLTKLSEDAFAIFGQAGYALTDRFKMVAGLRYEKQEMALTGNMRAGKLEDSWQNISPKLSLEYRVVPDVMTYLTVSQGFRSGGFNELAQDPEYFSYDPETLWSYEAGMKSLFLDKRVALNGAVFYMDIRDLQIPERIDLNVQWNTNAAKAISKGVEIESTARISDTLSCHLGVGYTDITFEDYSDAQENYNGNKKPFSPDYSFHLGLQYRRLTGFFARVDMIGYGKMFADKTNLYARDAYQLVNTKIGYETETFDIYLYGRNIFDETYDSPLDARGFYVVYSEPGEIGLQLTYRF
ncbi:MAG: TonB-dependent receptor [Deltaproteobacteria bacterium]|nr:MAG: TonB-dependent receptor [Deltaproteobacteria bacterium]